jgi:hypothetical protein
MKTSHLILVALIITTFLPFAAKPAAALSCLPVSDYLEDIVGNEEIMIFEAKSLDRLEETAHTIEILTVTRAHQGYVENKLFAYHEKHPDWGYLCNNGPTTEGTTSLYVASRNAENQYSIHQRINLDDPLATILTSNLTKENIQGTVSEITTVDRQNQIMTALNDLLTRIATLLKEYTYWSKQ